MEGDSTFAADVIVKEELIIEDELVAFEEEEEQIILQEIPQSNSSIKTSKICDLSFPNNAQRKSHERTHKSSALTCNICQQTLKSRYLLKKHVEAHDRSKEPQEISDFQCEICDKVFHVLYLFKKHQRTHRCEICDISFHTNTQRRSHVRIHKPPSFTCNICQKIFKEKYLLGRHMKAHQRSKEPTISEFHCQHCDKVFQVLYLLKRHMRKHGPLPFKCGLCPKGFLERTCLRKHEQSAHNISNPRAESPKPNPDHPNYCKECDRSFKTRKSFIDHTRKHKYIKEGVFKCIPCDKSFGDNYSLVLHENREHHKNNTDPKDFVEVCCQLCNEVFRSKTPHTDLNRHQKEVHNILGGIVRNTDVQVEPEPDSHSETIIKEELIIDDEFNPCEDVDDQTMPHSEGLKATDTFSCPACDKTFTCNRKYYMHQRRHRDLAYKCSICQKSFKEKFELDRHTKQVHRERPKRQFLERFHCSECGKTFSLEKLYKNHVARHGVRSFKCAICSKTFALKNDLRKHERKVHKIVHKNTVPESAGALADPSLHCEECDKFFTQRKTYLTHVRRHKKLKEGAFKCEPCQKAFSNSYGLTLHEQGIQHKNNVKDPAQCDICVLVFSSKRKLAQHNKEFHSHASSTENDIKQEKAIVSGENETS